ncbi:MAG TPA: IspD/TarI family cytidylyltransferase [Gemmatimonadota bacterium]|nr:IspD/TarI family cytidylyltransferase [Gemmatimonadota bacterium]
MAAGQGLRMGGGAKQFRLLGGRPAMCWAARPLLEALSGPLVLVLPPERLEEGEDLFRAHLPGSGSRLRVAPGGSRRQDSVKVGLRSIPEADTVLVHDASRPFASRALCERVARRAAGGRAVLPALPIHDTLKEVAGERVIATRDRSRFVAAQTPQGFPRAILSRAHEEVGPEEATDDAELCERLGYPVTWLPGEDLNRKLTDAADWWWAERTIAHGGIRW